MDHSDARTNRDFGEGGRGVGGSPDSSLSHPDAPPSTPRPAPVADADRIRSLDVLRGFAVLGILAMNIGSFSMPAAAYQNPTVWGGMEGVNGWVWTFTHLFADLKFMAVFSMLFGAGLVLVSDREAARGGRPWWLHLRRMFWLLLFGLVHAHLIWYGDILVWYAVTGTLVFALRNRRPRTLIVTAIGLWTVGGSALLLGGLSIPEWPEEDLVALVEELDPAPQVLAAEIEAYQGGFADQFAVRSPLALEMETGTWLVFGLWRVGGLMLFGMALFKLGVLSAARSTAYYRWMLTLGWGLGLPIVYWGVLRNRAIEWAAPEFFLPGSFPNYLGSIGVALGWVALVMLLVRSDRALGIRARLAATGRMAFTNYIGQSLICTWIFYGHGLGLFGQVDRVGQAGIMVAIWVLMLWASPLWLARFRYGPLEWLWRSLVYGTRQPFRRVDSSA